MPDLLIFLVLLLAFVVASVFLFVLVFRLVRKFVYYLYDKRSNRSSGNK